MAWESTAGSSIKIDYDKLFGRSPTNAVPSYSGTEKVLGSTSGITDLGKAYQDLYTNSSYGKTGQQMQSYQSPNGTIYDTTGMTPQQTYALQLAKQNDPNASQKMQGMGYNLNGEPLTYNQGLASNLPNYAAGATVGGTTQPKPVSSVSTYTPSTSTNAPATSSPSTYSGSVPENLSQYTGADGKTLSQYAQDPQAAQAEYNRALQVGSPEAIVWANQIKQYALGNQQPTNTNGAQPNLGGVGDVINKNQAQTDEFKSLLGEILNKMNNPNANGALQQTANQQGLDAFNQKQAQYQQLINSLKSGQADDLKNITNQTDVARQTIEDNSFQKWLAARQNVANRGLGNSGAASDADTRSILSRQRDLAGLYNTQSNALNQTNRSYSDKLSEAMTSLANNNLSQTQAEIFGKLFKDSQGSMTDQLKAITELLGKQLGYSQLNPADYLKSATSIYESDAKTKLAYEKLNQSDRQFYDKLGLENQKLGMQALQWQNEFGLKAAQIFGQDANGNPTLDAQKLVAELALKREAQDKQDAHNRVTEQQGWARINQADNEMAYKLEDMKKRAEQFDAQMQNTAYKDQAAALKQIMDVESRNMLNARAALKDDPKNQAATDAYNKAAAKIESTQKILTDISKLPKGTLGDTAGSGTYDISDINFDDLGDSYWGLG